MDDMLLNELLDDGINWNAIQSAINNLVQPVYSVGPSKNEQPTYDENFEDSIPNYSLTDFKNHFTLSRQNITKLCTDIAPIVHNTRIIVPLETKLLFYIWIIAKQESFLAVSKRFGFSTGTGHYIFLQILNAIVQLKGQFIRWPDARECVQIASRIDDRYNLPGAVGMIDGCHIEIKQPINNPVNFYNHNERHSVILQGVCNDECIFTDVFIGMPGKMHDMQVFRSSPLYENIIADPPLILPKHHLLADTAYPLMQNVLKPYRDDGQLSEKQTRFNQVLDAQCSAIKRAFALLKGKWRRLNYLNMSLHNQIPNVILSACILHNFGLQNQNEDFQVDEIDYQNDENVNEDDDDDENEDQNGLLKRDFIASIL